jgi:type II secretory pathway predicted ATPase ExeA
VAFCGVTGSARSGTERASAARDRGIMGNMQVPRMTDADYDQLLTGLKAGNCCPAPLMKRDALSRHVEDSAAERVHPVFLVDESHLLHQDTLDHLHILLN